jgi:(E)-4-hydroxy-3-methylbut-2-enyl-diphosphate synthase
MKNTKAVKIGKITIGAGYPVALQTMLKTPLTDTGAVIEKIEQLKAMGCDIIRAAVPDMKNAAGIKEIVRHTDVPFVADIHFDYRLAIESVKNGAAKLRINPGNIGPEKCVHEVVACLKDYRIPVRIGVNGGSLEKDILAKYGAPTAQALYESALRSIGLFNRFGYDDIVVSIKSSDVAATVDANRLFAADCTYPLHLGVTEAGAGMAGLVRGHRRAPS